jgi:glycerophosphoryl diester phosphodiesterase
MYAKKKGFLIGENDLWFTSDGVPVMVHMRDLSVVTDGQGNIDEVTYAYFQTLDFGMGATYGNKYDGLSGLSFDEWIELMKNLGMIPYIDTKAISPEPAGGDSVVLLKSILDKHGMTDKAIWAIGWTGAARIRTVMPKAKIAFTFSTTPTDEDIAHAAEFIVDGDIHSAVLAPDVNHVTREIVNKCHAAGVGVYSWIADTTIIDRPNDILQYVQVGIDGFISDGANITKVIDDYYYNLYGV